MSVCLLIIIASLPSYVYVSLSLSLSLSLVHTKARSKWIPPSHTHPHTHTHTPICDLIELSTSCGLSNFYWNWLNAFWFCYKQWQIMIGEISFLFPSSLLQFLWYHCKHHFVSLPYNVAITNLANKCFILIELRLLPDLLWTGKLFHLNIECLNLLSTQ